MNPLIVGLTGGIGSGKTTICEEFSLLGVPIINADHIAKDVVAKGQPALHDLTRHFGPQILNMDGSLNRSELRTIIFRDQQQRAYVEKLLHPLILRQIREQAESFDTPYVIVEIPLLIEAGWQQQVDQILVIDLPEELQIKRLQQRNGLDHLMIERIMASQLTRSKRIEYADQVIDNSGDPGELSKIVSNLHHQFLQLSEMRQR
ncbi:MAG: dephospho-CoA kinase [Gammaproteobacteria bacterium]|nr:dephospho-CoA kinase [Gammaproteobacteria bacterium]